MATPKKPRIRKDGEPDGRARTGGPGGTRPHVPTDADRRVVIASKAAGIENEAIAKALKISADTLTRHYGEELSCGKDTATAMVAGAMIRMATDLDHKDCQRAGQFWLQAQAGWRTKDERVHSFGGIDGPVPEVTDPDQIKPVSITFNFVGDRPKGLPGCAPEDRE